MGKKILLLLLILIVATQGIFSCRKVHIPTGDITLNYFPLHLGNTVTYNVDSIYWNEDQCDSINIPSQMMYAITDTFRDTINRLSYTMTVYTRPIDGSFWTPTRVINITPMSFFSIPSTITTTPPDRITTGLLYSEYGNQYIKLIFPVQNSTSWQGNIYVENNTPNQWLQNWNYSYSNYHLSYNNALVNFGNTITVTEDNESYNYLSVDSQVYAYRTYAQEVYAYNVGMVYKQWTHWTHNTGDNSTCKSGYQVIMQAIDYNIKN